ncbi:MAG TPA: CdaR family protein [Bacillales bacterium]|nr:CdaR family protein [Bacillales bacterium]
MDKLLKNNWFVKIISFLIAVLLYANVVTNEPAGLFQFDQKETGGAEVHNNLLYIDLTAKYDDQKFIVSGLPEKVTVQLRGSKDSILKTTLANGHKAFVDLRGLGPGIHEVNVKTTGFDDGMVVTVVPKTIEVKIQKKETKTLPVQIDLINESKVKDGYEIGEPIVSPSQVEVTGPKALVDKVSFVEGLVDVKGKSETVEATAALSAYDAEGNEVNVTINPAVVQVKVPITAASKNVEIQLKPKGSLPDGLTIQSIDKKPAQVTLFGPEKVLEDLSYIEVPFDLSGIQDDQTIQVKIPVPDGVSKVSPEQLTLTIDVAKKVSKTFQDIFVDVTGKSEGLTYTLEKPDDGLVDVTLTGPKETVGSVDPDQIEVYIDVSNLAPGEHTVPVQVVSLKNHVEGSADPKQAKVQVSSKE